LEAYALRDEWSVVDWIPCFGTVKH